MFENDLNINQEDIIIETYFDSENNKIDKKYLKGNFLGKGGFAKCYEIKCWDTFQKYAVKIISKSSLVKSRQRQKWISEIKIHKSIIHPNIVKYHHVFEDFENVYIILELCENQTLNELMKKRKRITELEMRCYLYQMVRGVKFLHAANIIHRDLKLGNIFLAEKMDIKLGDFGLAYKLSHVNEKRYTVCGTPNYIAPEVIENKKGHSFQADIWSIGIIIFTMVIGKPPFETPDVNKTYEKIKKCNYKYPNTFNISEDLKDLINNILLLDPDSRLNFEEILNHPFIKSDVKIPKYLPKSTFYCPPSGLYIKQFLKNNTISTKKNNIENYKTNSNNNSKLNENISIKNKDIKEESLDDIKDENNLKILDENINDISVKIELKINDEYIVDYINEDEKYGHFYKLSDNTIGALFRDKTILLIPFEKDIIILKDSNLKSTFERDFLVFSIYEIPKFLLKKSKLWFYFESKFLKKQKFNFEVKKDSKEINNEFINNYLSKVVYLKKIIITKNMYIMSFNTKILQLYFVDLTQIIISVPNRVIYYILNNEIIDAVTFNDIFKTSDQNFIEKIKYSKKVWVNFFNKKVDDIKI